MSVLTVQIEGWEDGRLTLHRARFQYPEGTLLRRLTVAVEGSTIVSLPFQFPEPDEWSDVDEDLDDDGVEVLEDGLQLYDAEQRSRGYCGHVSPRSEDGVEFTCEKRPEHAGMHSAVRGRWGW